VFAGLVDVFSVLKFGVLSHLKHLKEAPMKQAFVLGIRTILFEAIWILGTSYISGVLPG
jgi:hypothetical protein